MKHVFAVLLGGVFALTACLAPKIEYVEWPYLSVVSGLFDQTDPDMLGLDYAPGRETAIIFAPEAGDNAYNHGVVLFPFKDKLYAQWQTSKTDEDGPDTQVVYSVSNDGLIWSEPMLLAPAREDAIVTNGGWWSDGETLIAYLNIWPSFTYEDRSGYAEYVTSIDGVSWSDPKPVLGEDGKPVLGVIEQDIRAMPDGQLVSAFHTSPGLHLKPFYTTDKRGLSGWVEGDFNNFPTEKAVSREIEPSFYQRDDGGLVMLMRDQDSTYKTLASVSKNEGKTWSAPEVFDFPDSRSKQSAGNLPDGTVYRVNNPKNNKERWPLVVSLSDDGIVFDHAYVLRSHSEMQPMRKEGKYKRPSYSYPKSIVWMDHLYVGYATNKEDVELTRIPLQALSLR